MSAARILTSLFVSEFLFCIKSQNVKVRNIVLLCRFDKMKLGKQNFADRKKFDLKTAKVPLKTTLHL